MNVVLVPKIPAVPPIGTILVTAVEEMERRGVVPPANNPNVSAAVEPYPVSVSPVNEYAGTVALTGPNNCPVKSPDRLTSNALFASTFPIRFAIGPVPLAKSHHQPITRIDSRNRRP